MELRNTPLQDGNLTVIFTNYDYQAFLFKNVIEWVIPKGKKVYWIREAPYEMVPSVDPSLLADVACLKRVNFYYEGLSCLQKAVTLSTLRTVRLVHSSIIVEVSSHSVPHKQALSTCLAFLRDFACGGRKAVVVLPKNEEWMMIASLYTDRLFDLEEGRPPSSLVNSELFVSMD